MQKQFKWKIFARVEDDGQGRCVLLKFGNPYTGHTLQNTPIGRGDTYVSTFQRELPHPRFLVPGRCPFFEYDVANFVPISSVCADYPSKPMS